MPSERLQDKDFIKYKILTLLKQCPDLSQRDMAQRLGISNGGMHYCLSALMEKGLVKLGNFASSKHKLGYVYLLTPHGMAQKAAMASRFLERKLAEYEALKAEIATLQLDAKPAPHAQGGEK
jgi:EPS-associated MarR family transcriptional regulator